MRWQLAHFTQTRTHRRLGRWQGFEDLPKYAAFVLGGMVTGKVDPVAGVPGAIGDADPMIVAAGLTLVWMD